NAMSRSELLQQNPERNSQPGRPFLQSINRRRFLQAGAAAAIGLSSLPGYSAESGEQKKRAGLIGCGWYGKCDLFRLIQVAPVEIVSLCDVDKQMLAETAESVAGRQASKKKPRAYSHCRQMRH